jgi:hypothetical protein
VVVVHAKAGALAPTSANAEFSWLWAEEEMTVPDPASPPVTSTASWFAQTLASPLPTTRDGFRSDLGPDELHDRAPMTVQTSSTKRVTTFIISRARTGAGSAVLCSVWRA